MPLLFATALASVSLLGGSVTLQGAPVEWQGWVDSAQVPTANTTVQEVDSPCLCAAGADNTIFMPLQDEPFLGPFRGDHWTRNHVVLMHELGHIYDFDVLTDAERAAFQQIVHDYRPWWTIPNAPGEKFANAYMLCALYGSRLPARRLWIQWSYNYRPTQSQHAAACALIRQAAS